MHNEVQTTCFLIGGPQHGSIIVSPNKPLRYRVVRQGELYRHEGRVESYDIGEYVFMQHLRHDPESGEILRETTYRHYAAYEWAGWRK